MEEKIHDLEKTMVECQSLSELCNTIPSLPKGWRKFESPDWFIYDRIGLEITTGWSDEQRVMYGYGSPLGKTLSVISQDKKLHQGHAIMKAPDGAIFTYHFESHSCDFASGTLNYGEMSPEMRARYDDSVCQLCSHEGSCNIGADVLNYYEHTLKGLADKLDCLNSPDYHIYRQNWVLICIPEFGDTRPRHLQDLQRDIASTQQRYARRFDKVYLQLDRETIEFDMISGQFERYGNVSFDRIVIDKLKRAMTRGDRYELDEVLMKRRCR